MSDRIVFTWITFRVGGLISKRQKAWFESTQTRINFTGDILGKLKCVKMLGLTEVIMSMIANTRDTEMKISKKYRRIQSFKVWLGMCFMIANPVKLGTYSTKVNFPTTLGQIAVFATYAIVAHIKGHSLLSMTDTVTALSLVNLILDPLRNVLYVIPNVFSSLCCLERIQTFLLQASHIERRKVGLSNHGAAPITSNHSYVDESVEFSNLPAIKQRLEQPADGTTLISMSNAQFAWNSSSRMCTLAEKINLLVTASAPYSLTMIIGPVGCGKSTFLNAVLGETISKSGEISVRYSDIAFCDQTPWIVHGSIRANIIGGSYLNDFDDAWYSSVIHACDLQPDLARMPRGDLTIVGSRGIKLSGGQKQRVVSSITSLQTSLLRY